MIVYGDIKIYHNKVKTLRFLEKQHLMIFMRALLTTIIGQC